MGDNEKSLLTFSADSVIISENEINPDMFKILKGNVELYSGYGTENEVFLGLLGKNACFGEFGLLLQKPSPYTVIAYSDVILYRVVEEKMGDFIRENHTAVLQMMKSMANTMMVMQGHINQLNGELNERNRVNKQIVGRNKEMLKRYIYNR